MEEKREGEGRKEEGEWRKGGREKGERGRKKGETGRVKGEKGEREGRKGTPVPPLVDRFGHLDMVTFSIDSGLLSHLLQAGLLKGRNCFWILHN